MIRSLFFTFVFLLLLTGAAPKLRRVKKEAIINIAFVVDEDSEIIVDGKAITFEGILKIDTVKYKIAEIETQEFKIVKLVFVKRK